MKSRHCGCGRAGPGPSAAASSSASAARAPRSARIPRAAAGAPAAAGQRSGAWPGPGTARHGPPRGAAPARGFPRPRRLRKGLRGGVCGGAGGLGLHRWSRRREALAAWPALLRPSVVRGLCSCSGCSGAAPRAWPRRWMCPVRMPLGSGPCLACWPHHPNTASMKLPAPLPLCFTACPFGVLTLCCLFFASRVMFHISNHYNQVTSRHVWLFFFFHCCFSLHLATVAGAFQY